MCVFEVWVMFLDRSSRKYDDYRPSLIPKVVPLLGLVTEMCPGEVDPSSDKSAIVLPTLS